MGKEQLNTVIKELNMKAPDTGNDLSEALPFNLMFETQIGPTGTQRGFLRPETA
jgi:glycyl-tRNA synthetase